MRNELNRRSFLGGTASVLGAALLPAESFAASSETMPEETPSTHALDQFSRAYMKTMRAPGMTVGTISGDHAGSRVFGYSNVEAKLPVTADHPFWIGSICKSFVGIVCMQLRDEGKLDLQKPILEMMPDLPIVNRFGPITAHHLLTHTSGLPNWLQLFSCDPMQKAEQQYAPGENFAYCNLAFDMLGLMIAHLDGRSWPAAVTARIFKPLGMSGASGQIDDATQARMPVGYHFQYRDRPSAIVDPLVPVGYVVMNNAAGSIAATSDDMTRYMRMLLKRGVGPSTRIVSEEGFALFSKPYVKAPVLSPNSSYGYGIGVETIDGRTVLRHTGGATAFASSILVDLDGGVGAFASINSMQEYRPNPITKFAVDLLYAEKNGHTAPAPPALADPLEIKRPEEFVGSYKSPDGSTLKVAVQAKGLTITTPHRTTNLRPLGPNLFSAAEGSVLDGSSPAHVPSEFALAFGRDKSGVVTELSYGSQWYAGEHYQGTADATDSAGSERYAGLYTTDSPWMGALRIVGRRGKLWLEGLEEMHVQGNDRFTVVGGEGTLELKFLSFLNGRAQVLSMDGDVLRRVDLTASS
jgi:D-alanyl-D-alanine carboxypeptidase